jgi:hypothetical protein
VEGEQRGRSSLGSLSNTKMRWYRGHYILATWIINNHEVRVARTVENATPLAPVDGIAAFVYFLSSGEYSGGLSSMSII